MGSVANCSWNGVFALATVSARGGAPFASAHGGACFALAMVSARSGAFFALAMVSAHGGALFELAKVSFVALHFWSWLWSGSVAEHCSRWL